MIRKHTLTSEIREGKRIKQREILQDIVGVFSLLVHIKFSSFVAELPSMSLIFQWQGEVREEFAKESRVQQVQNLLSPLWVSLILKSRL